MTSLPSFMADMPALSPLASAFAGGGAAPTAPSASGAARDFAGLLDAAAGPGSGAGAGQGPGTTAAPAVSALPFSGIALPLTPSAPTAASLPAEALPVPTPPAAPVPVPEQGGNFLPQPGAQLPPALPLPIQTGPAGDPPGADLAAATSSQVAPGDADPATERPEDAEAPSPALASQSEIAAPPLAPPLAMAATLPVAAPAAPAGPRPPAENSDDAGDSQGSAVTPLGLALTAAAPGVASVASTATPAPAAIMRAAVPTGGRAALASAPPRPALPRAAAGEAAVSSAPLEVLPTDDSADSGPAASSAPAAAASTPAPSSAPLPSVPQLAPTPMLAAERPAEPPQTPPALAAAPTAGAARGESAIDQVGALREALRSAQPAMTLNHAEFGMVSLRIEAAAAAPDQWRAVLASRDPGFVPAIQTALAERALAPASETSTGFSGQQQHGSASQNGAGDQRYGASPNGGQGGSQPYLGQSGSRDGEAAPDHRRPSTAAALAARGDGEAEDSAARAGAAGGLFA